MFGRRSAREGANTTLTALLLLGAMVGLNVVADRRNVSWDLTASRLFSLAPQSARILEGLDQDLRLVVLDQPRAAGPTVDLFELYAGESPLVTWEVLDQEAEPARARAFLAEGEESIPFGTVVVVLGDRKERVSVASEQEITNAIARLLQGRVRKVRFLTGHGELALDDSGAGGLSAIRARLEESNYEVEGLSLLQQVRDGRVVAPEDVDALVLAGPRRDLLPAEAEALAGHLRGGGRLLAMMDPPDFGQPGALEADAREQLVNLLEDFGISPSGDVVLDGSGVGQLFGFGIEVPLAASYGFHPITRGFETAAAVFPLATSLIGAEPDTRPAGITMTELILSSDVSWGERDTEELLSGEVTPGDDEPTGPLALAFAVSVEPEASSEETEAVLPEGRLIVVGDSDFIGNNLVLSPLGNADLFLNMVAWLTEDEDLIAIRPRDPEDRRITMTTSRMRNVTLLSLVFLPGFFLLWGVASFWSRR